LAEVAGGVGGDDAVEGIGEGVDDGFAGVDDFEPRVEDGGEADHASGDGEDEAGLVAVAGGAVDFGGVLGVGDEEEEGDAGELLRFAVLAAELEPCLVVEPHPFLILLIPPRGPE